MFDDTRRSTALIPFKLRSLFYTCISLQSQELAPLGMANFHSLCTAESELVLLLRARNMCAQISTQ